VVLARREGAAPARTRVERNEHRLRRGDGERARDRSASVAMRTSPAPARCAARATSSAAPGIASLPHRHST
jgi:hypothetical protein